MALFHATLNLVFMLFPVHGSHFDMRLGGARHGGHGCRRQLGVGPCLAGSKSKGPIELTLLLFVA